MTTSLRPPLSPFASARVFLNVWLCRPKWPSPYHDTFEHQHQLYPCRLVCWYPTIHAFLNDWWPKPTCCWLIEMLCSQKLGEVIKTGRQVLSNSSVWTWNKTKYSKTREVQWKCNRYTIDLRFCWLRQCAQMCKKICVSHTAIKSNQLTERNQGWTKHFNKCSNRSRKLYL